MWCFLILILAVSSHADSCGCGKSSFSSDVTSSRRKRSDDDSEPWKNPNLPDTIVPTLYTLFVYPYFRYGPLREFHGNVSIEINVLKPTNVFIVHTKQLLISDHRVYDSNDHEVSKIDNFTVVENDYFVTRTKESLEGKARLLFYFQGQMAIVDDSNFTCSGMYNIKYAKENGAHSRLLVTDFSPSNARLIFPCFDEPHLKANFRIILQSFNDLTGLSNMPVDKVKDLGDTSRRTIFELSPKMSISQVAFAITDFSFVEKTVDGKLYRVWARDGSLAKLDYILEVTPNIQRYLSDELDMPYLLQKLDQFVVPGDIMTSPIQNWGLITYSESRFLVDATKGRDFAKHRALTRIANSLAHNYFGNLVTCRHWEHVWLHEGLAALYQVDAVEAVYPDFSHEKHFFGMKVESAMDADASSTDFALILHSETCGEKETGYENILQYKGAAVLRMLGHSIGIDVFHRGIQQYLKKHANGNVVTDDLWDDIQQELGRRGEGDVIKMVMKDWVALGGMPVIKVELHSGNRVIATPRQFFSDPKFNTDETHEWFIPVLYRTKSGNPRSFGMNKTEISVLPEPMQMENDWVDFNHDRIGYYRVHYSNELLDRIVNQLNEDHSAFSELSRSALISDAVALAKAEHTDYVAFLKLIRYADKEMDLVPWQHIHAGFKQLNLLYRCLRRYVQRLVSGVMDKLEVKDEGTYTEKQLRPIIMWLSCAHGHEGCRNGTTSLFKAWIQDETTQTIPIEYRLEVYCFGILASNVSDEWTITLERYKRATWSGERSDLLRALTCTANTTILQKLLDYAIETTTSERDRFAVVEFIAENPASRHCVWNWLKRKHAEIDETFGKGYAGHFLPLAVHYFDSDEQFHEVEDFYKVYRDVSSEDELMTTSIIKKNIHWMDIHSNQVIDWLHEGGWDM